MNERCVNSGCWPMAFAKLADSRSLKPGGKFLFCHFYTEVFSTSVFYITGFDRWQSFSECRVHGECEMSKLCVASFCFGRQRLSHAKAIFLSGTVVKGDVFFTS